MTHNQAQNSSKKTGRPKVNPLDKKRPRNLSISDRAWENLHDIAKHYELESVSELVEKTGQGQIKAIFSSSKSFSDSNISMYERLKFFLQPPGVVVESLILFVIRTINQLGVTPVDLEKVTCDVLMRAFTIVLLFNAIYPEKYINNPSSYIRYLSYFILLKKYEGKTNEQIQIESNKLREIDACISKISYASDVLMTASLGNFAILRMKCYEGLSLVQIQRVLSASGEELSIEEIIVKIKLALAKLRECWHAAPTFLNVKEHASNKDWYKVIRRYLELVLQPYLSMEENEQKDLKHNLHQALLFPTIDFWINEIDSYCGYILVDCLDCGDLPERIRIKLNNDIDSHFSESLAKVEQGLLSCTTAEKTQELLLRVVNEEAKVEIDVESLINSDTDVVKTLIRCIGNSWEEKLDAVA